MKPVHVMDSFVKIRLEDRSWFVAVGVRSLLFPRFLLIKSSTSPEDGVAPKENVME
jgi:hypothetical protein